MIVYGTSLWGFHVLFRLHGSALYKALGPATISTVIMLGVYYGRNLSFFKNLDFDERKEYRVFDHPYALGVFMVAYTFTLTFKLSFSYNRYWEACTAVHQMHSKWLDVGMELAAFHMQSNQYKSIRPPAFGEHPEITPLRRERDRLNEMNPQDVEEHLESTLKKSNRLARLFKRSKRKPIAMGKNINRPANAAVVQTDTKPSRHGGRSSALFKKPKRKISRLQSVAVLDGGIKTKEPALFLQELAHLLSLLSAVAFSTLRNDSEEADSPLAVFELDSPWQPVDPDDVGAFPGYIRKEYYRAERQLWVTFCYLLGFDRSEKSKAMYNLARPFRVIGGVSDAEIKLLQSARGPLAKVALCTMWLQEFISREYLNGSTGSVAPPIISRLYQYTSDGMIGYNQARKVAYIPFPFPHNQVTAFFTLFAIVYLPVLFLTYLKDFSFAVTMNLFTVWCFCALYEVARELERPFQNVPNDLPLNNFQHQFNEALLTIYCGFHPDAWWEVEGKVKTPSVVHMPGEGESKRPEASAEDLTDDISAETSPDIAVAGSTKLDAVAAIAGGTTTLDAVPEKVEETKEEV